MGLAGWVWDDLEHLRIIQLGLGMAPAHYLMYLSGVVVLVALVPPWQRALGYLLASVWLAAGVVLTLGAVLVIQGAPEVRATLVVLGSIVLLAIPLRAAWVHTQTGRLDIWPAVAAAGVAVVLVGQIVDVFWHIANPGASEMNINMLLLPGHQIQLAGWLVGLVGAGGVLLQRRARRSRQL